jgi:hypothetical protein
MHVYVVIKSLHTNIYSSLIQIESRPCMVCIAWHVADNTNKYKIEHLLVLSRD